MRVIAGRFKGRQLLPPASQTTRPITDRAKQSLFDILVPLLDDAIVYDCFAGTGSMGLECLSRGAARVTFFESDPSAVALLRRNIASLGVAAEAELVKTDLFRWFDSPRPGNPASVAIDLVFLDPPYRFLRERPQQLQQLAGQITQHHLAPGGILVFRHDAADALPLPTLQPVDERTYGSMAITLLRRGVAPAAAPAATADVDT